MYAVRRLLSDFPSIETSFLAQDRILNQQAASYAAPALTRTRYVGPAELRTMVRKGVRNHRVKMKRKTFVKLYRQAFPGSDGRTVTDYWQRLAKRAYEKGGSEQSPPTFSHEEMYDAYRLEVQEFRTPNERTLIDWIAKLVTLGVIIRRQVGNIRVYEWSWLGKTPECRGKKPRKNGKAQKVRQHPDFTRKPLGLASAKQISGNGFLAVAVDSDSKKEGEGLGLSAVAFDVEDRNNHQVPPCPVTPDEADEAANCKNSKAAAPLGKTKKTEETAELDANGLIKELAQLGRQAMWREAEAATARRRAEQRAEDRAQKQTKQRDKLKAGQQAKQRPPMPATPVVESKQEPSPPKTANEMVKPPKHDVLGTIAWLAFQAEKERASPEYQAKMKAEEERKKVYDAYCEAYDARQRQKERDREHRAQQEALANEFQAKRKPRVTKFADDDLVADAIFCQYQLRAIPFLREHWTQDFARRKYPRKIWRMAVAKALTKWNGQINKCRGAYVLSVADSIMQEGSTDPRLMPDFRVVVPCKHAAKFSGVTEWTIAEAHSSGARQET